MCKCICKSNTAVRMVFEDNVLMEKPLYLVQYAQFTMNIFCHFAVFTYPALRDIIKTQRGTQSPQGKG